MHVQQVTALADLEKAFAIRYEVFVVGQGCPPGLEHDLEDESVHFLATIDGIPAGACRWRKTDKGYKLERFAVLEKFRGFGVGQEMVKAVLNDLPKNADYVYLHAQTPAVTLYERFNFEKIGPEFEEAGMKHFKMIRK